MRTPLLIVLVLCISAPVARAQDASTGTTTPFEIRTLGLSIALPTGATATDRSSGDRVDVGLVDGRDPAQWTMRLVSLRSPLADRTGLARADDQIALLLEQRRAAGDRFEVLFNEPLACRDGVGRFCCIEVQVPEPLPGRPDKAIFGWFCIGLRKELVLVASVQIAPDSVESSLPILRGSFASLGVSTVGLAAAEVRKEGLDRGRAMLASFTPERLQSLVGSRQWYRLYQPGMPGAKELGCYCVEVADLPRGAVNPSRRVENYTAMEQEPGILVSVWGQLLTDRSDAVYRTEGQYWLAWDQGCETWSVRQTLYYGLDFGRRTRGNAVSGVRTRQSSTRPAGELQVVLMSGDGSNRDSPAATTVPDVYFSQALRWLEGPLFAPFVLADQEGARTPTSIAYYCVDTNSDRVAITPRIDEYVARGPDRWRLVTRPRTGADATITDYDADGRLIERTFADGSKMVQVELTELIRAWAAQGIRSDGLRVDE